MLMICFCCNVISRILVAWKKILVILSRATLDLISIHSDIYIMRFLRADTCGNIELVAGALLTIIGSFMALTSASKPGRISENDSFESNSQKSSLNVIVSFIFIWSGILVFRRPVVATEPQMTTNKSNQAYPVTKISQDSYIKTIRPRKSISTNQSKPVPCSNESSAGPDPCMLSAEPIEFPMEDPVSPSSCPMNKSWSSDITLPETPQSPEDCFVPISHREVSVPDSIAAIWQPVASESTNVWLSSPLLW